MSPELSSPPRSIETHAQHFSIELLSCFHFVDVFVRSACARRATTVQCEPPNSKQAKTKIIEFHIYSGCITGIIQHDLHTVRIAREMHKGWCSLASGVCVCVCCGWAIFHSRGSCSKRTRSEYKNESQGINVCLAGMTLAPGAYFHGFHACVPSIGASKILKPSICMAQLYRQRHMLAMCMPWQISFGDSFVRTAHLFVIRFRARQKNCEHSIWIGYWKQLDCDDERRCRAEYPNAIPWMGSEHFIRASL